METLSNLFLSFVIYAFFGWICEVIYCSIISKKFVNRGVLFLPVCPIYGFGALIVTFISKPFNDYFILVFIIGIISTTLVEFLTSYLLERIFGLRLWDYSHYKFNFMGRVCLLNSLLFGLMVLAVVYGINPILISFLNNIEQSLKNILSLSFFIILFTDTIWTILNVTAFTKYIHMFVEKVETEYKRKMEYYINKFPSMRINIKKSPSIRVKEFFYNRIKKNDKPE